MKLLVNNLTIKHCDLNQFNKNILVIIYATMFRRFVNVIIKSK